MACSTNEDTPSMWECLPENILLHIFSFLPAKYILQVSRTCRCWHRIAFDELLWKSVFYRHWKIDRNIPMAPGKLSWFQEFKRLYYHIPVVESEVIKRHTDQVLHVSFSHNGQMFATSSKDGYIRVWNANYPASLRNRYDMKELTWKYTQFSQFNESDTLLLVSGVHFGSNSTSGEIAVFSLNGDFELQARVINKPYDVFGTWYNDSYLLSGNLYWTGQLQSCSALWLNKAYQETESEHESVVMRLYRFLNVNASSVRTIMIAKCLDDLDNNNSTNEASCVELECKKDKVKSMETESSAADPNQDQEPDMKVANDSCNYTGEETDHNNIPDKEEVLKKVQCLKVFEDGAYSVKIIELDDDNTGDNINGTIEYNSEYRDAENKTKQYLESEHTSEPSFSCNNYATDNVATSAEARVFGAASSKRQVATSSENSKSRKLDMLNRTDESSQGATSSCTEKKDQNEKTQTFCTCQQCEDSCGQGMYLDGSIFGAPLQSNIFFSPHHNRVFNPFLHYHNETACCLSAGHSSSNSKSNNIATSSGASLSVSNVQKAHFPDKYLIFTMGSETYTPHQIGIKRIKSLEKVIGNRVQVLPDVEENLHGMDREDYDSIDHVIDLHGHIIGLCLSPDHRYLYINSRPWPKNYIIENVLHPPPIAQEIDIHVIDLLNMREVGTMHRSHKAYTPNDECFFIFLDACNEYVASGAEDKHGYIWDRHYGVCLNKFPHADVVNSVAFNPSDPETLVTVSDDFTIKIWRSRNREKEMEKFKHPQFEMCLHS